MKNPIRVYWSERSQRFYASQHYKIDHKGFATITGERFDVTNDIAAATIKHKVIFRPMGEKGE